MLDEIKLKDVINLINLLQEKNQNPENKEEDGRYVIVRTYSAGVFAGNLHSRTGQEVVLHDARRLWKWSGAASLSQLAMEGVKDPDNCMFPCPVGRVELLQVIEILDTTLKAKKSIQDVKIWEK
jgi:hypothetical protein